MFDSLVRLSAVLSLTMITLFSSGAIAAPIQFIYTGVGTGSVGSTNFTGATFTITQFGDTGSLQSCGSSCSFIDALSTSIIIGNVGSFSFSTGTRTFDNTGLVGFSRAGAGGLDLYNIFNVGTAYDMMSSIGPVSGNASLLQWASPSVLTDGGTLVFANGTTSGTFQAVVGGGRSVPEPASIALLGLGLAGLAASRRHKIS